MRVGDGSLFQLPCYPPLLSSSSFLVIFLPNKALQGGVDGGIVILPQLPVAAEPERVGLGSRGHLCGGVVEAAIGVDPPPPPPAVVKAEVFGSSRSPFGAWRGGLPLQAALPDPVEKAELRILERPDRAQGDSGEERRWRRGSWGQRQSNLLVTFRCSALLVLFDSIWRSAGAGGACACSGMVILLQWRRAFHCFVRQAYKHAEGLVGLSSGGVVLPLHQTEAFDVVGTDAADSPRITERNLESALNRAESPRNRHPRRGGSFSATSTDLGGDGVKRAERRWSACAWWAPDAVLWGLQLLRAPHAVILVVPPICLRKTCISTVHPEYHLLLFYCSADLYFLGQGSGKAAIHVQVDCQRELMRVLRFDIDGCGTNLLSPVMHPIYLRLKTTILEDIGRSDSRGERRLYYRSARTRTLDVSIMATFRGPLWPRWAPMPPTETSPLSSYAVQQYFCLFVLCKLGNHSPSLL